MQVYSLETCVSRYAWMSTLGPAFYSVHLQTRVKQGDCIAFIRLLSNAQGQRFQHHLQCSGFNSSQVLKSRNYLDWIADFETKLKLKDTIEHIMAIAQAHGVLEDSIMDMAGREVDGTQNSTLTLLQCTEYETHYTDVAHNTLL